MPAKPRAKYMKVKLRTAIVGNVLRKDGGIAGAYCHEDGAEVTLPVKEAQNYIRANMAEPVVARTNNGGK